MRVSLALIATVAISSGVLAQNVQNHTQIWDQTTEFTSRGSNGGNPGHLGQAFQYGFSANLTTLTRTQYAMQDQNLGTREPWNVGTNGVVGKGVNGCDPDWPNLRTYATNLLLPAGSGIGAFLVTHNPLLTNPHKITADQIKRWFHTWQFVQQTNWTTDGISVHMSQAATYRATRLCTGGRHREIPRADGNPNTQIIERLSWTGVANNPRPTWNDRTWRLVLSFDEAVLKGFAINTVYNGGCVNPNPGYASIDPNVNDHGGQTPARTDDLRVQVRSARDPADTRVAILFWGTKHFANGGIPIPGIGRLHIDLTSVFLTETAVMSGTSQNFDLVFPNQAIRDAAADLQGITTQAGIVNVTKNSVELTNPHTFTLKNQPQGVTCIDVWGTDPTKGAKRITHTARPARMCVWNRGCGNVEVQPERSGVKLGPAFSVGERSGVEVPIPAGATHILFTSPCNDDPNNATRVYYKIF